MKRTKQLRDYLEGARPGYWLQNNRYSAAWDKALLRMLAICKFEYVSAYEARIGPFTLWIENHPYASFTSPGAKVRPRRSTIALAWRLLIEDIGMAPDTKAVEEYMKLAADILELERMAK